MTTAFLPRRDSRRHSDPEDARRVRRYFGPVVRAVILLVGGVLLLAAFATDYNLYLASLVCAYATAALGLTVLYGWAGQLSIGHAAFFAVGAYSAGLVQRYFIAPAVVELLVVLAAAVCGALLVGVPALRLAGFRLAVVTLAFGELVNWALVNQDQITGGEVGLPVTPVTVGSLSMSDPLGGLIISATVALFATVLVMRLGSSTLGRAMLAIRETPMAAESVGVSLLQTKLAAFVVAGVLGAIGGWVFGHLNGIASPGSFDLFHSVYFLVAVMIGGASRPVGAWLGAVYLVVVPQILENWYALLNGVLLVAIVLVAPRGLAGLGRSLRLLRPATTDRDVDVDLEART